MGHGLCRSVSPGLTNLEKRVVVADQIGDPHNRTRISVGIGHRHPGQGHVACVLHADRIVDHVASAVRAGQPVHAHAAGDRGDVLQYVQRRIQQLIANQRRIISRRTDGNYLIAVIQRVGGLRPKPGRRVVIGKSDVGANVAGAIDIGSRQDFPDGIAGVGQKAVETERAIRIGQRRLFADVELVVAILVDVNGETCQTGFIISDGCQIIVGTVSITHAVSVAVVEFSPNNMSGVDNIPFGKACIIRRSWAELREKCDEVGRTHAEKCADREVEDIIFLALPSTVIRQDQPVGFVAGIKVKAQGEAVGGAKCQSIAIVKPVLRQRCRRTRCKNLEFVERDLLVDVLVDIEVDLVIALCRTITVEIEIDDRNVAKAKRVGIRVRDIQPGIIVRFDNFVIGVEAEQRRIAIHVKKGVEQTGTCRANCG